MKLPRLALSLCLFSVCALRAQDDEEKRGAPPVEIPDFSNLDEYIYVPKSNLHFGSRFISGPKASFTGKGRISTGEDIGAPTGTATNRNYHDGIVNIDARFTNVDNGDGTVTPVPIPNDGKTNSWGYSDSRQVTSDGLITMHVYSAQILDSAARDKSASSAMGVEVFSAYDMGKLGKYLDWSIVTGVSINDLSASTRDKMRADISSINDTYNLFGEIAPPAGYNGTTGSSTSTTTVTNADGTVSSVTTDTTVLLSNQPLDRSITTVQNSTSVSNLWKLKGSYFTFRAGPSISLPFASRFHASVSAGPSLVYAGTTYTVTQSFQPEIGVEVTSQLTDGTSRLLAGYYADATLQFDLTERTGFYLGAIYQANGSYDQKVANGDAQYSTKVDLNSLNGIRGGLTYRF